MCRALLYLGAPVLLDDLLYRPDSALVRQSTMPRMLHMLNLAGFGMRAWCDRSHEPHTPFSYSSTTLPVFDRNLKNLAGKVRARCVIAHVRGVEYSPAVDISLANVHPFEFAGVRWVLAHNGDLARFSEMKRLLALRIRREYLGAIRGSTDSEWIYALFLSQLTGSDEQAVFAALEATLAALRAVRAELGICVSSAVNLFLTDGERLAALRYCFDFGRYRTDDPARLHEANLSYLSLWYTLGRDYGWHGGEWRMAGGAADADSILVASEPLTQDTAAWMELPEYGALYAEIRNGRPRLAVRLFD